MILRLFWGLAPAVGAGVGRGWLWGRWVASGRAARVVAHFSRLFLTDFICTPCAHALPRRQSPKFFAQGPDRGGVSSGGAGVGWEGVWWLRVTS